MNTARLILIMILLSSLNFKVINVQRSNLSQSPNYRYKYISPKLKNPNQFFADVSKIKGFKRSVDLAKRQKALFNFSYTFFLNKDGRIQPHTYYVTDSIFNSIRSFVDIKFNKYQWYPARGKRGWLINEAFIELSFRNTPKYDSIKIKIGEPEDITNPYKKLYEIIVPYNKLRY